jgi:two-component system chemotaxis response regulator CheY
VDEEIKALAAIIVDGKAHTSKILRSLLSTLGLSRVVVMPDAEEALALMREERFDVAFCDENSAGMNPVMFSMLLRRDAQIADPMIPIILVSAGARRRQIELARDSGCNDVLIRPMSIETVRRKLKTVVLAPRPFIAAEDFIGPDRRRMIPRPFAGQDRRKQAPKRVKLGNKRAADTNPEAV